MDELLNSSEMVLPVVPIRDGIIFPGTEMILTFGRQRSVSAIEAGQNSGKRVILVGSADDCIFYNLVKERVAAWEDISRIL